MEQTTATKYFMYVRKSSESDERQVQSVDSQISELNKIAEREGLRIVDLLTEAKSAKAPGRKVFGEMLRRIEKGEADGILCWKLDRLARNPVDGGSIQWLLQQSILKHIQTYDKSYYPSDNVMLIYVELGVANQFIRDLSQNTKRGLRTKAEMGYPPGPVPVGYMNDPYGEKGKKKTLPDPERFEKMKKVWKYMLTGRYNPSQLLDIATNEWGLTVPAKRKKPITKLSRSGIYRLLQNPVYYGEFEHKVGSGNWYKGAYPPMITKGEFLRVQELLLGRSKPRPQIHSFTYAGLFRCGSCGASVTADYKIKKQKNGNIHYYTYCRCTKQKRVKCFERYIEEKELEKQILSYLKKLMLPQELLDWALEKTKVETTKNKRFNYRILEEKRKRLIELKEESRNLIKLFSSKENRSKTLLSEDQYKEGLREIEKETKKTELDIYKLERFMSENKKTESFNLAQRAHDKFKDGTPEEKRRIIIDIYEKGIIKNKKLILTLKPIFFLIKNIKNKKADD